MNFSGIDVLVVGDVMLDHYITGDASRVSPEAPVPVVSKKRSWAAPGGAANVARGLKRLGCGARIVGLAGNDAAGHTLVREIGAEGILSGIVESAVRPTSCKTRIMAHGQQLLRVDEESTRPPDLEERVALRLNMEKLLPGCGAVILSDYAKGVLLRGADGQSLCADALTRAAEAAIPVLVDPKGVDWDRYAGAQCVTPNSSEFARICDVLADPPRSSREQAAEICRRFHLGRLLLTRGPRGMTLFERDGMPVHIPVARREVADVSGAGDTVIATLAACVAKGLSWEEGAVIANMAAGVAVGKIGTAPVDISELNHALREGGDNPKLCSLPDLQEKLSEWRRQGQTIVFTNGCFDLLHPGHISLLRQAASYGDRLIVGLNSDASVCRLKGPERPVQNERSRALLLSAMNMVDAVIIFEEDTPLTLIQAIRPDILVKGADYTPEKVVGRDFVCGYGGQVKLASLVDGCSTTSLVRKMRVES